LPVILILSNRKKKLSFDHYFAGAVVAFLLQQAFLFAVVQAFLSVEEQQAFLSLAVHVVVSAFLVLSLFDAIILEEAKPIVNVTTRIIANLFMIL